MSIGDDYIKISALQHYAYCPRQCALIHTEQVREENFWTTEGKLLHERVDSNISEKRKFLRTERSVSVISHAYKMYGKLDLLEIKDSRIKCYYPVEYKRGKQKIFDWDKIQLCAQVLCLEEMLNISIPEAALWYWEVKQREKVSMSEELRSITIKTILDTTSMIHSQLTPKPIYNTRCQACSLYNVCNPKSLQTDNTPHYLNELFTL